MDAASCEGDNSPLEPTLLLICPLAPTGLRPCRSSTCFAPYLPVSSAPRLGPDADRARPADLAGDVFTCRTGVRMFDRGIGDQREECRTPEVDGEAPECAPARRKHRIGRIPLHRVSAQVSRGDQVIVSRHRNIPQISCRILSGGRHSRDVADLEDRRWVASRLPVAPRRGGTALDVGKRLQDVEGCPHAVHGGKARS
jgi:hypothetical protein